MLTDTKTLQLNQWAAYLPYGLMVQLKFPAHIETGVLKSVGLHPFDGKSPERITLFIKTETYRQVILPNNKKSLVMPFLSPLPELSNDEWISVFRAGIDALKVKFPYHSESADQTIEWHDKDAVEFFINRSDTITFDFTEKQFSTDCRFNQFAAFEKLYELHADIDNLIEQGLALNKKDYPQ